MDCTNISLLNELKSHRENVTIKVRIIRLWMQPVISNPTETHAKEMVLIDEQGTKMLASVLQKWLSKFEDLLVEKDCFFIKNLRFGQDFSRIKYVEHPLKANFTPKTTLTRCSDFTGVYYGFNFTSFDLLTRNLVSENKSVDVIGYIDTYFPIKDIVKKDNTKSKRMNLVLKDLEPRRINLTLWDSYAQHMSEYLLTHNHETNVAIILQFGMFKFMRVCKFTLLIRRAGISNSYHITKLYINEDICDINLFKKKLLDVNGNDASSTSRSKGPSMKMSLYEEFVTKAEFKHIAEIDEIKDAMHVTVFGTIMAISPHMNWYYEACKICNKQVIETQTVADGGMQKEGKKMYECKKCNKQVHEVVIKYRIYINVQDSTGVLSLVLWDWEANKVLKKSAKALYEETLNGDADIFPKDLKNLEDQRFAFKIEISTYNLEKNYKFYTISKVTQDPKIVYELEKKMNVDQGGNSDLMHAISVEAPSEYTVNFKDNDVVSVTGESSTPKDRQMTSTQKSSIDCKTSELKRNLIEIYPDDEDSGHSATKAARPTTIGIDKPHGKQHLLTPKVEK